MSQIGMSLNMQTVQRQEMRLAPRMIQAMKILQLPIMELSDRVEQELEENPVLERADADGTIIEEEDAQTEEKEIDPDGPLVIDEDNTLDFNRLDALNK